MKLLKTRNLIIIALMVITMSACGGKKSSSSGSSSGNNGSSDNNKENLRGRRSTAIARVACDATFENIMQQEIDVFEYRYEFKFPVLPYYISEKQCVDSLLAGIVDCAVIARPLTGAETKRLTNLGRKPHTTEIAVDAIAIIVNQKNPIESITVDQLTDILSGKYTDWSQLHADRLGKISVLFDHPASSTARCLKEKLLGDKQPFAPSVVAVSDSLDSRRVFEMVAKNPNALGVIGVSWVTRDLNSVDMSVAQRVDYSDNYKSEPDINFREEIKTLKVGETIADAVRPWQAHIYDGSYPLFRTIYMVNTGGNGTGAHAFYVFVTSWLGQKLMQETGILPKTIRTRVVDLK